MGLSKSKNPKHQHPSTLHQFLTPFSHSLTHCLPSQFMVQLDVVFNFNTHTMHSPFNWKLLFCCVHSSQISTSMTVVHFSHHTTHMQQVSTTSNITIHCMCYSNHHLNILTAIIFLTVFLQFILFLVKFTKFQVLSCPIRVYLAFTQMILHWQIFAVLSHIK